LPTLPLLAIGGALFAISRVRTKTEQAAAVETSIGPVQPSDSPSQPRRFVPVVLPWGIDCSTDLGRLLDDEGSGEKLTRPGIRSVGEATRELLFRQLGVPLPACPVQLDAGL